MYVNWMNADDVSRDARLDRIEWPYWTDVENALRRLDGRTRTQVFLMTEDAIGMCVTGGYMNRFICEIQDKGGARILIGDAAVDDVAVPVLENGDTDFPASEIVSLEVALDVCKTYLDTGLADARFGWR